MARSKHTWPRFRLCVALLVALALLSVSACTTPTDELEIPNADMRRFAADVYPVLLANCAFTACHGDGARPLSVFGPGRTRLDPKLDVYAKVTAEEIAFSYARARSMLIDPDGPRRALLLRKPLAISAGGAQHEGDDPWGRAVFASKTDPRYEALFFWAIGEGWDEEDEP